MEQQRASRLGPPPGSASIADDPEIGERLVERLRRHTGDASLALRAPPQRILGGFETIIYSFELEPGNHELVGPLIARVYEYGSAEQARLESITHETLSGQGYPAPEVVVSGAADELLGRPYIVMRRVNGKPMIDSLIGPRMTRMASLLGETHARLHVLDAAPMRRALAEAGIDVTGYPLRAAEEMVRGSAPGLASTLDWLVEHQPKADDDAVCHGDYHPLNVIVDGGVVTGVLDWPNVRIAPAAWDIGAARALFNYAPVSLPGFILRAAAAVRRWLWGRYVKGYATVAPLPDEDSLRYFETLRLFGFLYEVAEARLVAAGVREGRYRPAAFEDERTLRNVVARIEATTGAPPWLPERVASPQQAGR